jgi:hypothetical protein
MARRARNQDGELRESVFQDQIVGLARFYGWDRVYHTHDSRRSHPGFPDLVLVRGPELVAPGRLRGRPRPPRPRPCPPGAGGVTRVATCRECGEQFLTPSSTGRLPVRCPKCVPAGISRTASRYRVEVLELRARCEELERMLADKPRFVAHADRAKLAAAIRAVGRAQGRDETAAALRHLRDNRRVVGADPRRPGRAEPRDHTGSRVSAPGLCECGCGQTTRLAPGTDRRRGWIKGQPLRFIKGHKDRREPSWRAEPNGCWRWLGRFDANGYGRQGRRWAHRIVYELLVGPIPAGAVLDHLCRTKWCVNPDHLEPVTHAENCRRGAGTLLTQADVAAIRAALGSTPVASIAERFGVHERTVRSIRDDINWTAPSELAT